MDETQNEGPRTIGILPTLQLQVIGQLRQLQNVLEKIEAISRNPDLNNLHLIKPDNIRAWKKLIREEIANVEELRLRIVFVGTMNAGKSMTLNAIIGARLLPSRNTPMTSLPTFIDHVPDRVVPVLKIPKYTPFNETIREIRNINIEDHPQLDDDIRESYEAILSEGQITSEYEGENRIHDILVILNDVARLSKVLRLNNPLEEYTELTDLPRIEVAFASLEGVVTSHTGMLTLVDSPGPDSNDLSFLKELVDSLLVKSSAVTCVVDYTMLKSSAEEDIRKSVVFVQELAGSKLSVLVNKFDQRTDESLDEYETKKYVEAHLFPELEIKGHILSVKGKVFPVSSLYAFLANRARYRIEQKGTLASQNGDGEYEGWVHDFAKLAYGTMATRFLGQDGVFHLEAAQNLWVESMMDAPLKNVVEVAYRTAAPETLRVAMEKTQHITQQLKENIGLFNATLSKEVETLDEVLKRLGHRIKAVDKAIADLEKLNEATITDVTEKANGILLDWAEEARQEIQDWYDQKQNRQEPRLFANLIASLFGVGENEAQSKRNVVRSFDTEEQARKYLEEISEQFRHSVRSQVDLQIKSVEKLVNEAQQKIEKELEDKVYPILKDEQDDIKDTFDVTLNIPKPNLDPIEVTLGQIEKKLIRTQEATVSKTITVYERKWYVLWLKKVPVKQTTTEKVKQFVVNPKHVQEELSDNIRSTVHMMNRAITQYITWELANILRVFFTDVKSKLDDILESVTSGRKLQSSMKEIKAAVQTELKELTTSVDQIMTVTQSSLEGLSSFDEER